MTVTTSDIHPQGPRRYLLVRVLLALALVVTGLGAAAAATPAAAAAPVDPGLVAWYKLDETSGGVAKDSSTRARDAVVTGARTWRSGDGFQFSGGAASTGNAIRLPNDLLAGLHEVTVDFDVNVAGDLNGFWFIFNLGTQQAWPNGNGYLFMTGSDNQGRLRGAIAESGFFTEQSATADGPLARDQWRHVTYSVTGGSTAAPGVARIHVDGKLVAENTAITTSPARLGEPDGTTDHNWLGRSAYAADLSFKGAMRDVRVYDRALSEAEIAARLAEKAQAAVDAVQVTDAEGVRGNLALPTTGAHDSTLTWESSRPDVVTPDGRVTRPSTGSVPIDLELTVSAALNGSTATRTIPVRVLPMPEPLDPEAYVFPYFTGESGPDDEKIFVAASRGDTTMAWDELNDAAPILESVLGEKGLRDPFLIRSHEGDKFWLLATDLRIYGGNTFSEAQESGSRHLMVWESTDLVNWSEQRMVTVSSELAGNTWAPEAFYDEATGEYVVYWASNLYPTTDVASRDYRTSYNRMMYATTRDFRTFSEATPWVDVKRGEGRGMIDATVVRDGDTFYRFIKDEASMTVRQERSTDLRATVTGSLPTTTSPASGWQLVREKIGVGQPNPWGGTFTEGEGPTVFRDNVVAGRWWMLIDQPSYHGGQGYLAFRTDDIASGLWTSVTDAELPSRPRHGSVVPISLQELQRLRLALQPDLVARSAAPVTVTTVEGTAPVLPQAVPVTYADGSTRPTSVTWGPVDPTDYADWGAFEVHGRVDGHDLVATAVVGVRDGAAPVVSLAPTPSSPDGDDEWYLTAPTVVATAGDEDSGVRSVETAVGEGTWTDAGTDLTASLVPAQGVSLLKARAVDHSGNTSAVVERRVKVDSVSGVSRATWDAGSRTLTLRAADDTSGVRRIEWREDSTAAWSTYTGPRTYGDVARTVQYRTVDVAGNVEATNAVVIPRSTLDASRTTAVLSRDAVKAGREVSASVTVTGASATPTGTVRILAGGDLEVGRAVLVGGRALVAVDTATLGVGRWTLTVVYDGDVDHAPSSTSVQLRVTR